MAITEPIPDLSDPDEGRPIARSGRRAASREPLRMLAYVEQHDDGFEVIPLEGADLESHRFATLAEAAAFVAEGSAELNRGRARGVLAWIS